MPHKKAKKRRRAPTRGAQPEERPPQDTHEAPAAHPDKKELMKPLEGAVGDALKRHDP